MDYRNRYRRGGIVGLQRGGSWWDRMVNSLQYNQLDERGLPGEGSSYVPQLNEEPLPERIASTGPSWLERELARSAAASTPEAMRKKAEDRRRYGLDGLPSPEEMEFISGPRERRGYTGPGPESQEGQRAAMLAEEADAPDNRMQLMRMLKDGRLTEEQYQAGMDNLMFGGAGRLRPEAPLEEPASTPAATADAEEAATTQAIAAAEAAAPRKASGRFLSEAEQRAAGTYMPGVSDLERRWSDVGLSPGDVPFVNDAIIEDALAQRNMTGRYAMPDPLAGLMMSPEAPGSRQDILGDVRRRDLLEFPPVITDLLMEDQDPSVLRDEITRPPYIAPRHERALEGFEDLMIPGLPPAMDEQQRAELPPAMREAIPQARQARQEARQAGATKALEEDMTKGMLGETRPEGLEAFLPGHSSYWDSMQDIPSDYSFDSPRPDLPEPSLTGTVDYEPHFLRDGGTGRRILENMSSGASKIYDELGERWFGDPLTVLAQSPSGPIPFSTRDGDEVRIKPRSKNWLPYPIGYKEKMWEDVRRAARGRQTPEEIQEARRLMTTFGMEEHPMDHLRKMRALNALYYEPTEENPMGWRDPLAGTDYRRYQDGGVIPGYGIGGALGTLGSIGAGIFGGPAGAAAFGGLKGLFGKNKKKGFLKGILGGIIAGKGLGKLGSGLKEGWAAGAGQGLLERLKTTGSEVGTDFTEKILDPTLESLSDPRMAAFVYPGYAQASRPDGGTDTSPGAMIAQQTPVMGASADPANWQDGRFVDPGQKKVAEIMRSAMGGVIPGYRHGGMHGEEGDEFDEPAYRPYTPRPRRRRIPPREVQRPTRRQVEEEEEARLRENVEPAIPATIAAMPPTPAPRTEAPVEAPPENVEPVAPPTIARPPERVEGLPTPPPVVPTRPVAPPPPPPVAPPRQAPPGSGGDEIGDGPDLARQMAMVEEQAPLTSGAGGMGGEFEGDEYGDEYTPTQPVYSGGPTQATAEPDEGADEYEAPTQPIMDQVRDVVPNTAAFMPEPGEEGEGGGEGNLFLDSDPGDYGTPVGRTAETTYDMNPYGELPQEVIDGTRELTQTEINERANKLETETRDQIQQPDPLLQDPVGADPTHGLDDGGERPGDLGFVDQTALSPAEDPTRQFVENQFTGPAGHGRYMGHGYNERTAPVASTVPAKTGPAAGSVADHPDYVAGYHDETSRGTGETGASRVGLNPMKPQDQSALSQQQKDFISQFGKAEGGQIQEAPEQIRDLVKAALMGALPDSSIDVTQLMAEVDMTYPGLIEAIANEIRAERQMAGDGPPIVSEGYIPPFDDGMPESTGRVDDRAAVVSPMSDNAVAAGLERSLAEGGKVPISAVVAPEEYILDKQDTAASVQDLKAAVDHVAEASPTVSGPPMWDATRRRLDMEQGINA